jgi:porphobilinogen deaminase
LKYTSAFLFFFSHLLFFLQVELREEDRRYRDYLARLAAEEKAKELELERLVQKEVDASWQKKIDQWRTERMVRKKLLDEVIQGRAQQLQERCECSKISVVHVII